MKMIRAVDRNWALGYKGELLFHIKKDMQFFREKTLGKIVIMGRKTFESLPGGALENRENIVLSRQGIQYPGARTVRSVDELMDILGDRKEDAFVIGGGEIYSLLMPYSDTVFITKVDRMKKADTFFYNLDIMDEWEQVWESEIMDTGKVRFRFTEYRRKPCVN